MEAVTSTPWINLIVLTLYGLGASLTVWLAGKYLDLHLNRSWWRDAGVGALVGALLPTIVFGVALGILLVLAWEKISRGELRLQRTIAEYAPPAAVAEPEALQPVPGCALDCAA